MTGRLVRLLLSFGAIFCVASGLCKIGSADAMIYFVTAQTSLLLSYQVKD